VLTSVMVWLAGEDLVRAVDLLEQHHPGELVRQRLRAEREPEIATLELDPEMTADHEAEVLARLPPLLDETAEGDRVEHPALGAQQHRERARRDAPVHPLLVAQLDRLHPRVARQQLLVVLHIVRERRSQTPDG